MEQKQKKGKDSKHCSPVRKPGPVTMDHVLLALQEPEEDRDLRLHNLFNNFDKLNLGYLDHAQIEAGLSALHIPSQYKHARDLLNVCDANKDGRVDYLEFRCYMDAKELELYRIFQDVDVEHSGCISPEELSDALVKAGIEINDEELACFVEHVDKDNNGVISFKEWRNFLLLYPHEVTIENIYHYYERICLVDIGEQATIPEGISKHGNATKYLLAGGVAGAVSRTATAPIDRLKVKLQVETKQARIIPAIKEIWNEGKFLAFFRGNGLNAMKVAPESAIKFYAIEMLKTYAMNAKGEDKAEIGGLDRLVAGGLGGAIAQTAIYPMDLVKTRLQTYDCKGGKPPNLGAFTRDIWVKEGPRAFYRGTIPSLLGIIPYAGIDRAGYETLTDMSKKYILHENEEPGLLLAFWCGTISSAVGATCVYPLQVVRTRMQVNFSKQGASMSDVFWKTFHEGGLYKGLFPNLLKVVPAAGISYLVFEAMKKRLQLE